MPVTSCFRFVVLGVLVPLLEEPASGFLPPGLLEPASGVWLTELLGGFGAGVCPPEPFVPGFPLPVPSVFTEKELTVWPPFNATFCPFMVMESCPGACMAMVLCPVIVIAILLLFAVISCCIPWEFTSRIEAGFPAGVPDCSSNAIVPSSALASVMQRAACPSEEEI